MVPCFGVIQRLVLVCLFALLALSQSVRSESSALVYRQFEDLSVAPWTFRIAFFVDPDAGRRDRDDLTARLTYLAEKMVEQLASHLVDGGFGDLSISVLDDYAEILTERWQGNYHILYCDPGIYLAGQSYPAPEAELWNPFEVLVKTANPEAKGIGQGVGIWVHCDSALKELADLRGAHVAILHEFALNGGMAQTTYLASIPSVSLRKGSDYNVTQCGSVSDALGRLLTGLGTQQPVQAAFLPTDGAGFEALSARLGLSSTGELPIRLMAELPDPRIAWPLLVNRYLVSSRPALGEALKSFFLNIEQPQSWLPADENEFLRQIDQIKFLGTQ